MPPKPPSNLLGNAVANRETASTTIRGDRVIAQNQLTAAERKFQQQRKLTLKLEKEILEIGEKDAVARNAAYKKYEKQLEKLNSAQQEWNKTMERSLSVTQRLTRELAQAAGAKAMEMLGQAGTMAATQTRHAYQDLIQTQRRGARETIETTGRMMDAVGNYNRMLFEASQTALRYGSSTAEVLDTQRKLIQGLNADVTDDNFIRTIEQSSDELAFLSARTGHATGELSQFTTVALRAFGRGTQSELQNFTRDLTVAAQIPSILRQEMEQANQGMEGFGAVFSNEETMRMLMEWTHQFGDQATSIEEMAAAMGTFRRRAAEAGSSIQTINRMQQALVTGISGRQGDDANSLLGGRILRQRIQEAQRLDREAGGGTANLDQIVGGLNEQDRSIVMDRLMNTRHGLGDVDLMRMLQGTSQGMDAMMESLVGIGGRSGDISITRRMLKEQGISTGSDQDDIRLAELVMQRGQGQMVDPEEIQELLTKAQNAETTDARARENVYRNVGAINEGVATIEENITSILRNVTGMFDLMRSGGGIGGRSGGLGEMAGGVAVGNMLTRMGPAIMPFITSLLPVAIPVVLGAAALYYVKTRQDERRQRNRDMVQQATNQMTEPGGQVNRDRVLARIALDNMSSVTGSYSESDLSQILREVEGTVGVIETRNDTSAEDRRAAATSLLTKLQDIDAMDDIMESEEGMRRLMQIRERIRSMSDVEPATAPQVLIEEEAPTFFGPEGISGRDSAAALVNSREDVGVNLVPALRPTASQQPGSAPSTVGTAGNPIRPIRPGTGRVDANGNALVTVQIPIQNFTGMVGDAQAQLAQGAPPGFSISGT